MTVTVIVGTGVAGATAALALREAGEAGPVALLGEEPGLPYRRPPLSKELLRGTVEAEALALAPEAGWAERGVEVRGGAAVTRVLAADREVELAGGERLGYDRLLLATGARPRTVAELDGLPGVQTLRSLADALALRSRLRPGARLAVIGAGLIGGEVAASARGLGCEVTVIEAADRPLQRLLPAELAEAYAATHRAAGVELRLGTQVTGAAAADGPPGAGLRLRLSDGGELSAETVVVAIGAEPRTDLAESAGARVADGVVVDEGGRTGVAGIWAAGDVASTFSGYLGARQRYEHWNNARDHGRAVARAMLGLPSPPVVPWCWSSQYERTLQICGWPAAAGEVELDGDPSGAHFLAVFREGGRLLGAIGAGRAREMQAVYRELGAAVASGVAGVGAVA